MSKAVLYSAFAEDDAQTVADGLVCLAREHGGEGFANAALGDNLADYKARRTSSPNDVYFRITVETVQQGEAE